MNREEAKRLDDESLAQTFMWQVGNRPQRERIEAFGRYACRLIGEAIQASQLAGLGDALQEAVDVQEPEDRPACERLVRLMDPSGPMDEGVFQNFVDLAIATP